MKRIITITVSAALGLALMLGLTVCGTASDGAFTAEAADAPETEETVTVSASDTVRLVPDKATVSFGVTTQEKTAELAQSKNSEAVKNVIAVLTERGTEEKSIRTTGYSMYPRYDWSDYGDQRIIGYQVTTTMTVQDQDIEDLGALLSACVAAGINDVDTVRFLCSDYDEAYRQALAQAVAASREKAEVLAEAAGKKLGGAVSIVEGWQDSSARYGRNTEVSLAKQESADAAGPILQPGESEIRANVTVTYRMG
ncbi:MAG: SIMPL domain-containing protein [Oscillospiraceae bacterium]|nr:SIMPL domain-containing protein [Oscillospiraceae bacterium]